MTAEAAKVEDHNDVEENKCEVIVLSKQSLETEKPVEEKRHCLSAFFALTASVLIGVANYLISKLSVKIGY